jgi:hypothetical protein
MSILKINLDQYLTSKIYDPSPHRIDPSEVPVSERRIPIIYRCENCDQQISLSPDRFQLHSQSKHSNLKNNDRHEFENYMKKNNIEYSFLDFYCPKCSQPTTIIFEGNPSGYWGIFEFSILEILIKK